MLINIRKVNVWPSLFVAGFLVSASGAEEDKIKHFAISAGIGFTATGLYESNEKAMAACLSIGLAKEIYDHVDYGGFSGDDLVMDSLGCTLGVITSEYTGFRIGVGKLKDADMLTFAYEF